MAELVVGSAFADTLLPVELTTIACPKKLGSSFVIGFFYVLYLRYLFINMSLYENLLD